MKTFLANLFTKIGLNKYQLLQKAINYQRKDAGLAYKIIDLLFGKISYLQNSVKSKGTIVLLHGFGGDKDNWNLFVKQFKNKYHVIAIDMLGHGDSSNAQDYSIENQTRMLDAFLAKLDIDNIHLVGNSMGGAIALMYSIHGLKKVETLTLIDPLGLKKSESELDIELKNSKQNPMLNICSKVSLDKLLHYGMQKPPYIPSIFIDIIINDKCKRSATEKLIFQQIYENTDLTEIIQNLDVKTLIIWGEKDRVLHRDNAQLFHHNISKSKLVILENVGHVPQLEAPKKTATVFLEFLKEY
ncbi:alpha/beta fold hydrolase [Sulfurimonas sp.]|uniref:alpha/beta fold hydrolase n=1 Tax=Sulfurimonas sp. TaxID=2022749 RepID=UPI003D0DA245